MSSEPLRPLEFFLERSLGKLTADGLRERGWTIHTIYEHFDDDGAHVADEEWIEFDITQGWVCLTKDRKMRFRADEIGALARGHVFCLADGNLKVAEMVRRFAIASGQIQHGADQHEIGFWHVHDDGRIVRMWPRDESMRSTGE